MVEQSGFWILEWLKIGFVKSNTEHPSAIVSTSFSLSMFFSQEHVMILLMEEILHQFISSWSHHYKGLYIPGG